MFRTIGRASVVCLMIWSSLNVLAQTPDEALVRQAEKSWNEAIAKQDVAAAGKFLADDYVLVGVRSTGFDTVEREPWLQNLAAMRLQSYETEVVRVRIHGDSAVVSVKGGWHILHRGQEIDENFFLTDVWCKTEGGWKVALRHSSPYPR
jgi:ketosteroid isomerase-like protein